MAFWALLAAVILRTAGALVPAGWPGLAPWVVLSGPLVWIALAAVGGNLLVALIDRGAPAP